MIRHNKEECIQSAKTCKTKEEFKKKFRNQHASAIHNGWYTECTQHMPDQSQTKYKTLEDIVKCIENNNISRYKDLPKGLIRKAKQLNGLNLVKNIVQCGPTEKSKHRKAPNSNRPQNINEWYNRLQEIGITLLSKDYLWSEEDSTGRKYLSLEIQCNNTFDSNNKNHPSVIQRITNIERNLKSKKSCCPYCIKTFYISNSNSKNHDEDIKRNFDILQIWAKKNNIYINPLQDFSKSSQKVICTDVKSGKERKILISNILRGSINNPFSSSDRMNERFKIKYKTVKEVCISKGFELITTENEYNQLTIKDKTQYSPSTRKIVITWNGIKYKYPIGQIIKPLWLPQDFFISEEIVRYQMTKFFKFKFEFQKVKPDTLIGKKKPEA